LFAVGADPKSTINAKFLTVGIAASVNNSFGIVGNLLRSTMIKRKDNVVFIEPNDIFLVWSNDFFRSCGIKSNPFGDFLLLDVIHHKIFGIAAVVGKGIFVLTYPMIVERHHRKLDFLPGLFRKCLL